MNCRRLLPKTMILCSGFVVVSATKSRICSENNVFVFRSSPKYRLLCVICLLIASFMYLVHYCSADIFHGKESSFMIFSLPLLLPMLCRFANTWAFAFAFDAHHTASNEFDTLTYKTPTATVCLVTKIKRRENSNTHNTLRIEREK